MAEDPRRNITPYRGGLFADLANRIKLILRLLADKRVSPLLKLIPIGSLVYLIFPDIAPGPIDDAAIIWLGTYLFVELCPPEVVEEHMAAISHTIPGKWRDPSSPEDDEIVDGEYREEP
ncbi:MAG TPA: hypothetical protein VJ436_02790 [Anaerolineales bacterium]|nr:hypothetical protein [Anaerolineales bacterium]